MWRAVASLERLPIGFKLKLGDELMRAHGDAQGPRGRRPPVGAVAARRARAALRPAQRGRAGVEGQGVARARSSTWDWPEPDKAAFPLAQLGAPHRRSRARSRRRDAHAARRRSCARCPAASARPCSSSRSSRSRRARSASRSATRCRPACGWSPTTTEPTQGVSSRRISRPRGLSATNTRWRVMSTSSPTAPSKKSLDV